MESVLMQITVAFFRLVTRISKVLKGGAVVLCMSRDVLQVDECGSEIRVPFSVFYFSIFRTIKLACDAPEVYFGVLRDLLPFPHS